MPDGVGWIGQFFWLRLTRFSVDPGIVRTRGDDDTSPVGLLFMWAGNKRGICQVIGVWGAMERLWESSDNRSTAPQTSSPSRHLVPDAKRW